MAKHLTKEGLGNILNTVVGMKPKTLPANLEKNDIVLHQNKLYKYKGEPKQVSIVSESEFKKAGLRFMGEDYKVVLLNDILELYKWMYQNGLNGHKLGSDWGERPKFYYVVTEGFERVGYSMWKKNYKNHSGGGYFAFIRDRFGINYLSECFEFPIYLTEDLFINSIEDEKKFKFSLSNLNDDINLDFVLKHNKFKFPKFKKFLEEKKLLLEHSNSYSELNEYLKSNPMKFTFYKIVEAPLETYETLNIIFERNKRKYSIKSKDLKEEYNFGVYGNIPFTADDFEDVIDKTEDVIRIFDTKVWDSDNQGYDYSRYWKIPDFLPTPVYEYSFGKEYREKYNLKYPTKTRFFLPYFIDAATNDTAKELNEKHNKYGVFVQGKEDGEYTLSFKVCMSTRDQHEEYTNATDGWGDQYAFSPTRNQVRQESLTYVMWKKNDLISFELNWKVENGTAKDWKLKLLDENKRNTQGLDNFMKWIQVETSENYLFLQLFYAVYSYDDSGSWNEWQFAHILPPFNLEFKGE